MNTTEKKLTGYPSIDKPWLKYYSEEAINAIVPKCSIYQNIYNGNIEHLSDVALLYFGKKITYRQLFSEVDRTAQALVSYGVKYRDNVAICMPATPETLYVILALNKIGANANMLNPTFSEQQLAERINETGAELLFVVNELYQRVNNVIPKTTIKTVVSCAAVNSLGMIVKVLKKVRSIPNTVPWNEFIRQGGNCAVTVPDYEPNHPAIIVYSSGTTGAAKGIQFTNDSVNSTITQGQYIGFEWKRQDKYFSQIPIWFSTGVCATMLVPLRYGITIILEPMYDYEVFYQHISKYHPNFMITATGLVDYLREKKEIEPAYKHFKYLVIGGEYVTPHAEKKFSDWLQKNGAPERLHKGYGMCECGGTVTASHYKCNVVGSAGIPTPHVIVSSFDMKTGEELKYGERGEIRVLTPSRMIEYYKNPEATVKFFHKDEQGRIWACTGDMGYVTEDGCVYVDGRISSSYVNTNNEIIYLFDIERAILDVEQVRQCKVVVSEINGNMTHIAHIVLSGKSDVSKILTEIKRHCLKKLESNHVPILVRLYDSALPVASSGKFDVAKMEKDITELIEL